MFSPFEESRIFSILGLFFDMNITMNTFFSIDILRSDFFSFDSFTQPLLGIGYFFCIDFYHLHGFQFSSCFYYVYVSFISFILSIYYAGFAFFLTFVFSETNYNIALVFAVGFCSYCCYFLSMNNKIAFQLFQNLSDYIYYNMILPYLGLDGKRYFPFFFFLFYFILTSNFLGLIPGFFAITSHFNVTLFLSSICWLSIFFIGIYFHGFKFFSSFFPSKVPFVLSPFLMFIELLSYIVRLASLSLRLFANIVAGHILLDTISMFFFYLNMSADNYINVETIFVGLFLWLLLFVMILFESLIALLQAYIFVVLAVIYLNDSIHLHV